MGRDDQLYRACAIDLRSMLRAGLPGGREPRTVDDLCALIERRRGLTIPRYPASLGGHPYGLVLRGRDTCLILYERHTTPWHQQAIILHECGHVLYDHRGMEDGTVGALRVLVPDLPLDGPALSLRRAGGGEGHHPEDERQAEVFATVALARLSRVPARIAGDVALASAVPPDDPAVATVVRRLLEDFAGGGER